MLNKKFTVRRSTLILVVSYYVYLITSIWAQTEFETTYDATFVNIIQWIAILLVVVKIVLDRSICGKHLLGWIAFLALCLMISYTSGNYRFVIPVAAYILASSNIDSKVLIKTALYALITMMVLTVVCSVMRIIPFEYELARGKVRYALGFRYTTYLANYYFHAVLIWISLKRKCPNLVESGIIMGLNAVIFALTNTRAVFYEIILLLVVYWIFRLVKDISRSKLRFGFLASFWVCAGVALLLQIYYRADNLWMSALNTLMTYRLYLGHRAYLRYGLSLFGQTVEWNTFAREAGTDYFYVDSSYLNIAITYGIIWLILLLIGLTLLMKKYIKEKQLYCCMALAFLAIHSISDPQLFSLICNPFLFLLGSFFPFSNRSFRTVETGGYMENGSRGVIDRIKQSSV